MSCHSDRFLPISNIPFTKVEDNRDWCGGQQSWGCDHLVALKDNAVWLWLMMTLSWLLIGQFRSLLASNWLGPGVWRLPPRLVYTPTRETHYGLLRCEGVSRLGRGAPCTYIILPPGLAPPDCAAANITHSSFQVTMWLTATCTDTSCNPGALPWPEARGGRRGSGQETRDWGHFTQTLRGQK